MLQSWEKKGNAEINVPKKLCCNPNPLWNQNVTEDYNSHVSAVRVGRENEGSWSSSCSLKLFACTRHGRGNKDSQTQTQTHERAHTYTHKSQNFGNFLKPNFWAISEQKKDREKTGQKIRVLLLLLLLLLLTTLTVNLVSKRRRDSSTEPKPTSIDLKSVSDSAL
jgi:hypothetical protein